AARMNGRAARRGQPVAALVLLLGGWCLTRVMLWEAPFPAPLAAAAESAARMIAPMLHKAPDAPPEAASPAAPVIPPVQAPREPLWLESADSAPPAAEAAEPPSGWTLAADAPAALAPVPPRIAGG